MIRGAQHIQQGDIHILESFDGAESLALPSEDGAMISYGDFGAPPVNFITRRGYKQDGATLLDQQLGVRSITLEFNREAGEKRDDYWNFRADLHDLLRHNRGGPLRYTLLRPDGSQRSLSVVADPGMTFPPAGGDNWQLQESIRFIAHDPIWFDPDATALTLSGATGDNLVFPATFSILFGPSGVNFTTGPLVYPGTWESYPTITLTGPYTWVVIQNTVTNATIGLSVPIGAGATRTIVLERGSQSVTDQDGNNKFADLAPDSNLIGFAIQPDPIAPGGAQEITVQMQGGQVGQSGASISYNNRYVAI